METSFAPVNLNTETQRTTVHSSGKSESAASPHEPPLEKQLVLPVRHVRSLDVVRERVALEFVQILTSIDHKTQYLPGETLKTHDHLEPVQRITPTPRIEPRKSIEPEVHVRPVESVVAYSPIADKPAGTPLPPPWRMPLPVESCAPIKSPVVQVERAGSRIDMTI